MASINSPQQVVLSGEVTAVDAVTRALEGRGLVARSVRLPVSAPFHCSIMKAAAVTLSRVIVAAPGAATGGATTSDDASFLHNGRNNEAGARHGAHGPSIAPDSGSTALIESDGDAPSMRSSVILHPARIPLIANVSAATVVQPGGIRRALLEGIFFTVRWSECVTAAVRVHGAKRFIELGSGDTLAGLIRQIAGRDTEAASYSTSEDIRRAAAAVGS